MDRLMRAARVHQFGGPEVINVEELPVPKPNTDEVLVRVRAAGVGPWDSWVRSGRSAIPQPLPLTLGSDISGVVHIGNSGFSAGEEVYGVTNARFTGGYAQYAAVTRNMLARKPHRLSFVEAASVPVVALTAWQMLFRHAGIQPGQRLLVHGALGNVGAYAVQLAKNAGISVLATARPGEEGELRQLGVDDTIGPASPAAQRPHEYVDAVIDTVGGDTQDSLFAFLKPGGALVSAVSQPNALLAKERAVRAVFFLVSVDTQALEAIGALIDSNKLAVRVGTLLPLTAAREAHEMLEGNRPHANGKIVLDLSGP